MEHVVYHNKVKDSYEIKTKEEFDSLPESEAEHLFTGTKDQAEATLESLTTVEV